METQVSRVQAAETVLCFFALNIHYSIIELG